MRHWRKSKGEKEGEKVELFVWIQCAGGCLDV